MTLRRLRTLAAALLLAAAAGTTARAHFVWVVLERGQARVGLGETPDTIDLALDGKVAQTVLSADGRTVELARADDGLSGLLEGDLPALVEAACDYGVIQRHGATYPLLYHARAQARPVDDSAAGGDGLRLAWVECESAAPVVLATWRGEPLPGAALKVFRADGEPVDVRADDRGRLVVEGLADGRAAVLAKHVEAVAGRRDGMSFAEARHYATLTVALADEAAGDEPRAETEADSVLRRAHEARHVWGPGFPGFEADVLVRTPEAEARGRLRVSPEGGVELDIPAGPAKTWAERQLRSVVMHRGLNGHTSLSPGARFLEPETATHPLGRLIELGGDGMGSAYRIQGDEITEVNRTTGDARFSNQILANSRNAEGQVLPLSYTVAHWDDASGALKWVETFHATWARVGRLDLPATHTQVVAQEGRSVVRRIELSGHTLPGREDPAGR